MLVSRGSFKCDNNCPRYKECAICAHTIAVAHDSQNLSELLRGYTVPLKKMVDDCVPAGSGKNESEKRMSRKRKSHPERDVSGYGDRVGAGQLPKPTEIDDDNMPYELVFIKDTVATTCYGCKGKVRENHPMHHLCLLTTSLFVTLNVECIAAEVKQN